LHPFEGTNRLAGGFRVSACHRSPWRQRRGKELCRWGSAVFRAMPPLRVHPPRGRSGTGASKGVCGPVPRNSSRLWEAGLGRWAFGSSALLRSRQQAGSVRTHRKFGGDVRGRGSAWTAAACRRYVRRVGWNPVLKFQATVGAHGVDGFAHPVVATGWFSGVSRAGWEPAFQRDAVTTG